MALGIATGTQIVGGSNNNQPNKVYVVSDISENYQVPLGYYARVVVHTPPTPLFNVNGVNLGLGGGSITTEDVNFIVPTSGSSQVTYTFPQREGSTIRTTGRLASFYLSAPYWSWVEIYDNEVGQVFYQRYTGTGWQSFDAGVYTFKADGYVRLFQGAVQSGRTSDLLVERIESSNYVNTFWLRSQDTINGFIGLIELYKEDNALKTYDLP